MDILMLVTVEAKDGGALPHLDDATARLGDILADVTKHDSELGWRVTEVRTA